jgi:hypothetical protein
MPGMMRGKKAPMVKKARGGMVDKPKEKKMMRGGMVKKARGGSVKKGCK